MGGPMTHGADIIRPDFTALPDDAKRKASLCQSLMAEGMAQLIRHRLSTPPSVPSLRPDHLLITQLRQSGMARVTHDANGLHLSMHGHTATAACARGVLWEWSNTVLGSPT